VANFSRAAAGWRGSPIVRKGRAHGSRVLDAIGDGFVDA
jgi:hypothetical protein